jgi:hypothetical protein
MWPLGAVASIARWNPASSPASAAGRGRGECLQLPRVRFRGLVGLGRRPAGGAPAAGGGGRRGLCCGAARARVRAGEARVAVLGVGDRR